MTHVAYLTWKLIVAGARRMWLKTEAMVPPTLSFLGARACQMLGAVGREMNQTLLVSKECEMLIKDVITYF